MRALFAALLLSTAALPVRPIADARKLVAELGHGKPLVLHFWATWCVACRTEFPRLRAGFLALPGRGVEVALVTIDRPDDRAKAEEMLRHFHLATLPALLLDAPSPDPVAQVVGEPKWDGTLPATFVFDAHGKLAHSFIGVTDPVKLEAEIRKISRRE
jgi:thiol-disulfide isomerase/thioredoxin